MIGHVRYWTHIQFICPAVYSDSLSFTLVCQNAFVDFCIVSGIVTSMGCPLCGLSVAFSTHFNFSNPVFNHCIWWGRSPQRWTSSFFTLVEVIPFKKKSNLSTIKKKQSLKHLLWWTVKTKQLIDLTLHASAYEGWNHTTQSK